MHEPVYAIVITPMAEEDGGGFSATIPDLLGCMSDGETPEEALTNVRDAIKAWIAMAHEFGQAVPKPSYGLAPVS